MRDSVVKGEIEKVVREAQEREKRKLDKDFRDGLVSNEEATRIEREVNKM